MESYLDYCKSFMQFIVTFNYAQFAYSLISPYQYNTYESIQQTPDIENQLERRTLQFVVITGNLYVNTMVYLVKIVKHTTIYVCDRIMEFYSSSSPITHIEAEPFVTVTKDGKED